jgi:HEAT repeat protein
VVSYFENIPAKGVFKPMIAERPADVWFDSRLRTANIYRLIEGSMGDRNEKERMDAVIALGESGDPRAVRPLMNCCGDGNPEIRLLAITALGKLKSARATTVLVERIRDKQEEALTRRNAVAALAAIRSFGAIEELKELLSDEEEDPLMRDLVVTELERTRMS